MSGPSLEKLTSHRSIHNGAVTEGRDLLRVIEKTFREGNLELATIGATALVEHWETRTISHADSEEEGFYVKKLKENPEIELSLARLKRDHDLLRTLVSEIKQLLAEHRVNDEVIDRFKAIYVLVQIHNRDEERLLLEH